MRRSTSASCSPARHPRSDSPGLRVTCEPSCIHQPTLPCRAQTRHPRDSELKGESTMPTGTVRLHRVLRANPERVYRAFLDADAIAKWLPPYGFTCKVHYMDAKVGGTYSMSFTNFTTGHGHSFGGEYREVVPFERIRYTGRFEDPNLPGKMRLPLMSNVRWPPLAPSH